MEKEVRAMHLQNQNRFTSRAKQAEVDLKNALDERARLKAEQVGQSALDYTKEVVEFLLFVALGAMVTTFLR